MQMRCKLARFGSAFLLFGMGEGVCTDRTNWKVAKFGDIISCYILYDAEDERG